MTVVLRAQGPRAGPRHPGRRLVTCVAFVGVGLAAVGVRAPGAGAKDADGFGLYRLDARATAAFVTYAAQTALQAIPVGVGLASVEANIDETPSSAATASPVDPGLVAGVGGLLPVLGFPGGLLPPYPLAAAASQPVGEKRSEVGVRYDVPGDQRAEVANAAYGLGEVDEQSAHARATVGRGRLGGAAAEGDISAAVFDARSVTSDATVRRDGPVLVATAETQLSDVVLLGGLITIDGVTSRVSMTWRSPDEAPDTEANGSMTGLRVLGMPAAVTPDGLAIGRVPGLNEALEGVLGQLGGGTLTVGERTDEAKRVGFAVLNLRLEKLPPPFVPPVAVVTNAPFTLSVGVATLAFDGAASTAGPAGDATEEAPSSVPGATVDAVPAFGGNAAPTGDAAPGSMPAADAGTFAGQVVVPPTQGGQSPSSPDAPGVVAVFLANGGGVASVSAVGAILWLVVLCWGALGMMAPAGARAITSRSRQ